MATKKAKSEELRVASGVLMRATREKGMVLPFPSGNNYRVRFPTAASLLRSGNLPNPLLSFVIDAYYNGMNQEKFDRFFAAQERLEAVIEADNSFKAVCQAMFIEPRIVDEPQAADEITIDDLPAEDQVWAFQLVFLRGEVLYPFREQPATPVASVAQSETVAQAA